ncbi:PREDICTED: peptidyl-tRNA hydrolase ICT1, mitochondrial [Hipposideros armiger]|uniref:Peptidyl-tRNA hydrolase ICT1, mitochondrial n=1 Tax=Hipposideros armiger TaxID=186990 RepID=A0A8B7RKK8_HIPAR|nr:PREDICTED: peptidyl-tRNA hydrolase ICT1, mitochondrial [Hipposideros armiger]
MELKSRRKRELADRESRRHRKRLRDSNMAAAWCLRLGLSRARARLLPPPAHCLRRDLHKQVDGTEFQSIYSLDKLYPESRGLATAWRVPVSREGRAEGAFLRLWRVTSGSRGPIGQARR